MRKICISLSKGGVGKSTGAVCISHALAMAGRRVLLVDTDDQGQDGFLLGVETTRGLPEVIADGENPVEVATKARPNLFLLSGGRRLSAVKRDIGRKDFGAKRFRGGTYLVRCTQTCGGVLRL
ncbi:MAG: AAA family ATPase [Simkaniaceae bacterium]|nr:AAA family ATPase [Simkaniaceae bacterium]